MPDEVQPQVQPEIPPVVGGGDDIFDDDFGPDFNVIQNVAGSGANIGEAGSKLDPSKASTPIVRTTFKRIRTYPCL